MIIFAREKYGINDFLSGFQLLSRDIYSVKWITNRFWGAYDSGLQGDSPEPGATAQPGDRLTDR
jgi:hypothetical protein